MVKNPMAEATEFILKVAKNPERYPQNFVVLQRDTVAKILSGERVRILDYLEKYGSTPELQKLARALGRMNSAVARDLKELEAAGLVERKRNGKAVMISSTRRPILVY